MINKITTKPNGINLTNTNFKPHTKVACPRCNGTGKLDGNICYGCNGRKFIFKTAQEVDKEYDSETLAILRQLYRSNSRIKVGIDKILEKEPHPDYKQLLILEWSLRFAESQGYKINFRQEYHERNRNAVLYLQTI